MRILILGGGAREHAIARSLKATAKTDLTLFAAPGNPGIAEIAELVTLDIQDPAAVAQKARELAVDLVVVGPEAPLVAGVADAVRGAGIACFGPSKAAAQLEGSKSFAKEIMAAAGVPTADSVTVHDDAALQAALDRFGAPYVVKDDGLAGGKGVVVTSDRAEALAHGNDILARGGDAAVVVEDFLDGPELSLFCLCDGTTVVPLAPAQDFKRVNDGDLGPNTGGMGAYSPVPIAPPSIVEEVVNTVAKPTLAEMARRGTPFQGLLYCGLDLTSKGVRVVEFNVRFGDPETQAVLARLKSPLDQALMAAATGHLAELPPLVWKEDPAVCVVVAAANYPGRPITGDRIEGIDEVEASGTAYVLHAGTAFDADGHLVSAGGRVISVIALGADLATAQHNAYLGVARINLAGSHYRHDIAAKAIAAVGGLPA
ncbi:MAG: phosphoribosylamine--glycine ligase [Bifidobacteriaceae bacterium]|nr:phosphoribosylamine--glycine ligase [Bifidobacteriaceae bacterium]